MIESPSHIIEKVTIDVQVNSIELANEVKENSDEWVRDVLSSTLVNYFSKLEEKIGDQIIQLSSLGIEIDVDSLAGNSKILANELVRKLEESFKPLIDEVLLDSIDNNYHINNVLGSNGERGEDRTDQLLVQDSDQRIIQSLIYFLDTGQLPWWIKSNLELTQMFEQQSLSNVVYKHSAQITKEFKKQASNNVFIQRLIDQFSSEFIWMLVSAIIYERHSKKIRDVRMAESSFENLMNIDPSIKAQVLSLLINSIYLRNQSVTSNFESTLFKEVWSNSHSVFRGRNLNGAQIFQLATLVSALSDGTVVQYSSKRDFQEQMASKMASRLDSVQLTSITNHADVSQLDQAVLTIFEDHLTTITQESKSNKPKIPLEKVKSTQIEDRSILEKRELTSKLSKEGVEKIEPQKEETNFDRKQADQEYESDPQKKSRSDDSATDKNPSSFERKEVITNEETIKLSGQIEKEERLNSSTAHNTDTTDESQMEQSIVSELISSINTLKDDSLEQSKSHLNEKRFLAENGGLVLLNPFLVSLFKNLNFLDDNSLLVETDRAVYLLHYLATGNEKVFEHHLTFEKFLCGIPLNTTISREITLTEEEKEEAEKLLRSVCEHWKKLNTSSIGLIRKEFLTRNCKVDRSGDSDRIKVERKAFDVLLGSLPWNISILKFPWKKELIFVEW